MRRSGPPQRVASARWSLVAAVAATAVATSAVAGAVLHDEAQRAGRVRATLEEDLARERYVAEVTRRALLRQARAAESAAAHNATLEADLQAVEGETIRLYEVVRAMRQLGQQLGEEVGLPGPALEALPELPPEPVPGKARADTAPGSPGAPAGPLVETGAVTVVDTAPDAEHALHPTAEVMRALPANTGPWPGDLVPAATGSGSLVRLAALSGSITRQWEGWQELALEIERVLDQRAQQAQPRIRPAAGPITSRFGPRPGFGGLLALHTGIDISLPLGTEVAVTASGTVTFAGDRPGYGTTVEVQHAGGLTTRYAHLSRALVQPGQAVTQGEAIALSGNTGISTGPHLHYEVLLNEAPVDPAQYW